MKKILITIIISVAFTFHSCYQPTPGSGIIITKDTTLDPINAVVLDGIGKVTISAGFPQKITVRTDDNFIDKVYLTPSVNKKILTISTRSYIAPTVLEIDITMEDISELSLFGSGQINVTKQFNQGSILSINNSGSGNIYLNDFTSKYCVVYLTGSGNIEIANTQNSNRFSVHNSGSGTIKIQKADFSNFELALTGSGNITCTRGSIVSSIISNSGSGNVLMSNSQNQFSQTNIYGSGSIEVNVTDKLDASIEGSGNIYYWGNPATVNKSIKGSGKLMKMD